MSDPFDRLLDDFGALTASAKRPPRLSPRSGWRTPLRVVQAVTGLGVIAVTAIVVALTLGNTLAPAQHQVPTSTPAPTDSDFPSTVLGMPVVTISEAQTLLDAGRLDGRAVAVRGYWITTPVPSCPAPMRWMEQLEQYCVFDVLSDVNYSGWTCTTASDGSGQCEGHGPPLGADTLNPILVSDSAGAPPRWSDGVLHDEGIPVVLVVHAGDQRSWECPADTRADCWKALVVDRIAWLAGEVVDLQDPDPYYSARMTIAEVAAAVPAVEMISATPVTARDLPGFDPRLHLTGDQLVWFVRSLRTGEAQAGQDSTRAVDEWVVDDATGRLGQQIGLEGAADYRPARLRTQAFMPGGMGDNGPYPIFRLELADGAPIQEGQVGGGSVSGSTGGEQQYLAGPAVLVDAGHYVLRAWLTSSDHPSEPSGGCSEPVTVAAGDDLRLEAAFSTDGTCVWRQPTFSDSLY